MDLATKKTLILNCVKLGMPLYSSCIMAECSDAEMEALDKDAGFQQRAAFEEQCLKRDLLAKLHKAIEMNSAFGNTTEVRWMLDKIMYGKGENDKAKAPPVIRFEDQ